MHSWSRRKLLGNLAAGAGTMGLVPAAFAQNRCRDGYGQGRCPLPLEKATAPVQPVFAPTGWKTTALESITFDVVDYKKEASFYAAVMGWKLREDDGKQAIMDVGNWGNVVLRGAPADSIARIRSAANGRPAARAAIRSTAWVIDKWDAKTVAAELSKRGMTPVADNKGAFESFHVKDPEGFDVQLCNSQGLSRARKTPATAKLSAPLPFESTGWKTVWIDHLSYSVSNYKRDTSFYANLLGWQRAFDEGSQNELLIGDIGDMICRGGNVNDPAEASLPASGVIDHISWGIAPWDVENVRAALESRGLRASIDTSSAYMGPDKKMVAEDIYQAAFQSYHTETPNGYDLQISWVTFDKRLALANTVKPRALRKYPTPL